MSSSTRASNSTETSQAAKPAVLDAEAMQDYRSNSLWRLTLRRTLRQRNALIGLIIIGFLLLVAIFAPVLAPYDPTQSLIGIEDVKKRTAPCIHLLGCPEDQPQHFMGTDGNVRDEFSRLIYGTRVSLMIGFTTVGFAIIIGTFLGAVAGYFGTGADNLIMRVMDVLMAFPALLLAIAIVTVLGRGLQNALLAIAIVTIPVYARVIRSSVLSVKETEYVEASRAQGASSISILVKRILPNAMAPLIVVGTLGIATAILDAAARELAA